MPTRMEVTDYIDNYPQEVCDAIQEMLGIICPNNCKECRWKHLCTTDTAVTGRGIRQAELLILGQNSVEAQDMISAMTEEPTQGIDRKIVEWLETAFWKEVRVVLGGTIEAPDGHRYKCVAVGWKRVS